MSLPVVYCGTGLAALAILCRTVVKIVLHDDDEEQ